MKYGKLNLPFGEKMKNVIFGVLAVLTVSMSSTAMAAACGNGQQNGNNGNGNGCSTATVSQADIKALQDRDNQLAADIHTVHMNTLTKYNETAGKVLEGKVADHETRLSTVENKVDTLNHVVGQNKQDIAELQSQQSAQNEHINAVQNAAQTANDRASDLEKRADTVEQNVRDTNKQLEVTDARSIDNSVRLDSVESKNKDQDKLISTKADKESLASEVSARQASNAVLDSKIENNKVAQSKVDSDQNSMMKSESASRAKADSVLSSRIDNNDASLVQHDQRITSNTQRVGAVENRVQNLEQSTNKRFSDMDKRVGENRKVASAGIAGAGAMANIPQVSQGSTFSVGAGAGGYDSEQAVAVGFSARINNNVVTKMSVSTNTQSEVLWGAGVGVEW